MAHRPQRTWRDHMPERIELVLSQSDLTVGEEFARARALRRLVQTERKRAEQQAQNYLDRKRRMGL